MSISFKWIVALEGVLLDDHVDELLEHFGLHEVLLRGEPFSDFKSICLRLDILSNVFNCLQVAHIEALLGLLALFEEETLGFVSSSSDHRQRKLRVSDVRFGPSEANDHVGLLVDLHALAHAKDGDLRFGNELEDCSNFILRQLVNLSDSLIQLVLNVGLEVQVAVCA